MKPGAIVKNGGVRRRKGEAWYLTGTDSMPFRITLGIVSEHTERVEDEVHQPAIGEALQNCTQLGE